EAADRGGRLGGARDDDAGEDEADPRGGGERDSPADLVPADREPVLLRGGLCDQGAADRAREVGRGDPEVSGGGLAALLESGGAAEHDAARAEQLLHGVLQRGLSD